MLPSIPGFSYTDSSQKIKQISTQQQSTIFNPVISILASSPSGVAKTDADISSSQSAKIPIFESGPSFPMTGMGSQLPSSAQGLDFGGSGISSTTLMLLGVGAVALVMMIK